MRLEQYRKTNRLIACWCGLLVLTVMIWQLIIIMDCCWTQQKLKAATERLQQTVDGQTTIIEGQNAKLAELRHALKAEVRLAAIVNEVVKR